MSDHLAARAGVIACGGPPLKHLLVECQMSDRFA
jgi:hypothetical protein